MTVPPQTARIESVNVGSPRSIEWLGRNVTTAIFKSPVAGRVRVRGINVEGDDQADRSVHGGVDKAVYAYGSADIAWWSNELGRRLEPGAFGENLTVSGLSITDAVVGEHWRAGSTLLEVAQPRVPCFKLGLRMGDQHFPPRFAAAGRPGAYLRILEEGEVASGAPIEVVYRPDHGITVGEVARIYHTDHSQAERLLQAPELPQIWQVRARTWLQLV